MHIAEIYKREGDLERAADWYLRAAEYARDSSNPLGAVALLKRGIRTQPSREDLRALYASLWKLLGLGDEPDPV